MAGRLSIRRGVSPEGLQLGKIIADQDGHGHRKGCALDHRPSLTNRAERLRRAG